MLRSAISTVGLDTLGDGWKQGLLRVIDEIESDAEQTNAELQDLKLSGLCTDVGAVTHARGHRHQFGSEEVAAALDSELVTTLSRARSSTEAAELTATLSRARSKSQTAKLVTTMSRGRTPP